MDAAEYKHVVLGLIFLKYISDAFEERYQQLLKEEDQGADPEDPILKRASMRMRPASAGAPRSRRSGRMAICSKSGRYVGTEARDDGEPFEEKMQRLTAKLGEQNARVGAAAEGDPGQEGAGT